MAQSIVNTAAFSTAYMKPDPDDVGDALWGQKIADNTGWLFFRPHKVADFGGLGVKIDTNADSSSIGTWYQIATTRFRKEPGLDTIWGTAKGTVTSSGPTSYGTVIAHINGVQIFNYHSGENFATSISYDISGLTNGVWYEISAQANVRPSNSPSSTYGMLNQCSLFVGVP